MKSLARNMHLHRSGTMGSSFNDLLSQLQASAIKIGTTAAAGAAQSQAVQDLLMVGVNKVASSVLPADAALQAAKVKELASMATGAAVETASTKVGDKFATLTATIEKYSAIIIPAAVILGVAFVAGVGTFIYRGATKV